MKVKKPYILLLILFWGLNTSAQKKLLKEIEKFSAKMANPDFVLARLQKENDLVFGYATYNPAWGIPPHYWLIAKKGNQWKAFEYIVKRYVRVFVDDSGNQIQEPLITINTFEIDDGLTDSLFKTFKTQKPWELKRDVLKDQNFPACSHLKDTKFDPCSIRDANSEGLSIMTKQYINSSSFYAPEYYETECCPGNSDRQRFLATIAPIKQLFKTLLQK